MKVSLFYLPSVGSRPQIEQGMVGLRGDLYTQMLRELSEQARLADEVKALSTLTLHAERDG